MTMDFIFNLLLAFLCFSLSVVTTFLFLFVYKKERIDIMKKSFYLSLLSNIFVSIDFIRILLSQNLEQTGEVKIILFYLSLPLFGFLYYALARWYHVLLYKTIPRPMKYGLLAVIPLPVLIFLIFSHFFGVLEMKMVFNIVLVFIIFIYFIQTAVVVRGLKNRFKKLVLFIFLFLDILIMSVMTLSLVGIIQGNKPETFHEFFVYILFNIINIYLMIKYFGGKASRLTRYADYRHLISNSICLRQLSGREKEIIELLKDGLTNKNIGRKLFINENTVKTHISHIYQKLHVCNRVELLKKLMSHK